MKVDREPDVCPHLGVRKMKKMQQRRIRRRSLGDRKERSENINKEFQAGQCDQLCHMLPTVLNNMKTEH